MNLRQQLTNRSMIIAILVVQIIPLLLFPPESYASTTQEWWLPALLVIMVIIADVELIGRRSDRPWPWYIISFANGFNIISRIMMVWSHAAIPGTTDPNLLYILFTIISVAISAFMLTYTEWPEVRMGLLKPVASKKQA
jgi:hypothetical protein